MWQEKWLVIPLICAMAALAVRAQEAPTTNPSDGGIVRGHVNIKGGGLFQHPDLTRVVVYIASNDEFDKRFGPTTSAVCVQKDKTFIPSFLIVPRGSEVEFPNWDDFDHNVFSRSAAAPAFDLDRYPKGQSKRQTFEKLGVVQVFCNIHPQMRAVIYVTPNRFFARADAHGDFQITGLPPGSYQVVAWNDRCDEERQVVQVLMDKSTEVSLQLHESRDRALENNGDRKDSYGVERGLGVKRENLALPVNTEVHPAPEGSKP